MYSAMEYGYGMRKRPVEEVTFYRQNKKGKPLKVFSFSFESFN